jgi:hypothetical protein
VPVRAWDRSPGVEETAINGLVAEAGQAEVRTMLPGALGWRCCSSRATGWLHASPKAPTLGALPSACARLPAGAGTYDPSLRGTK